MIRLISVDQLPRGDIELPRRLVPFIWYFVRQAWPAFLLIAAVRATADVCSALVPYFIKLIVDALTAASDKGAIWDTLAGPAAWFIVAVLLAIPVFARLGDWLMAHVRPAFTNMMRRQLALYMHRHSYGYFQSDFAGRLASKVVETPDAVALIMQMLIGSIGLATVTLVVSLVLFVTAHWIFLVIALVWLVVYVGILALYVPRVLEESKTTSDHRSIVRGRYVDTLTNILSVKLFARWRHEDAHLLSALNDTSESGRSMMLTINRMNIVMEFNEMFFVGSVFAASVFAWQQDWISVGDVAMILPMAIRITHISWWMSEVFTTLFQSFGQVEEGMETITQAHSVTDRADAPPLKINRGHIRFENVSFSYGSKAVFENLSLDIPAGQRVGLIGPSGAGKSTLVQVLLHLFDIQGGRILIDGHDIADVTQDSLRESVAVIPQSSDLLHRSLRDNIRFGRLDATDDEIIDAARRAHAHDFIQQLEDHRGNRGYDTLVGERGVKLSGGQRQRIAIARAVLKNSHILLLDEATSALDSESEQMIQQSLVGLMQGKTVIAIAHRLSTISHLDRLIVMDEGRIVEDGSHDELLARRGLYARLWAMQSGGFLGGRRITGEE